MSSISQSNKRIAKNTFFLYFRMMLIMGVSLFTVRIILKVMGAEDYGIQNVVGGVVVMLSFFTSTMTSASMRFFTFELGRKDHTRLNQFFNLTIYTYIGIAFIILILAETVGLWFVKTQLTIPENRTTAAFWVYQFSIFTFIIQMFVIPFNSMIIAHEKMDIYAYFSIAEAILKLLIVFLLIAVSGDKLIVYAFLLLVVTFFISLLYMTYCFHAYAECRIRFFFDRKMFKELISYSGWSLWGALAGMVRNQGINILLNIFFNPVVNAARAIAYQVNTAVNTFVTNFYQAVRPQITKRYAAGETDEMLKLVFRSSRFCYYLILVLSIPILLEAPYILSLWLTEIPEYAILFTRLVIITAMIESLSYPLQAAINATGKIGLYQTITGGLLVLNMPISYILLKLDYTPQSTMYVAIIIAIVSQISRILFANNMHKMSVFAYLKKVVFIVLLVTILSFLLPAYTLFLIESYSFVRFLSVLFLSVFSSLISIYFIGISRDERVIILGFLTKKILKHK